MRDYNCSCGIIFHKAVEVTKHLRTNDHVITYIEDKKMWFRNRRKGFLVLVVIVLGLLIESFAGFYVGHETALKEIVFKPI